MYIKKLQLLNFQVIEKFDADFSGNVYFVTGDNELGKSTLLKAIGALLTGQRDDVLRNGASKGFAKMVVGDDGEEYEVSLSFTEANPRGTLTIKQKTTGMQTNNVTMLQKIFGYQDFDAVEFTRWSETAEGRRKQIAVVKALLPESVREKIEQIDSEVAELKERRTGVNRDVKTFATLLKPIEAQIREGDIEKYSKRMDISGLMAQQQQIAQLQEKAKTVKAALEQRTLQLSALPDRQDKIEQEMNDTLAQIKQEREEKEKEWKLREEAAKERYTAGLAALAEEEKDLQQRKSNAEKWLADYEASNAGKTDISEMLANADAHNAKCSLVEQYLEKKAQYNQANDEAVRIEQAIADNGEQRAELIKTSSLPIEGLSFSEDGLELNGIPFVPGKVSDSQAMEIAAKLVIASNPTVKVFRIARGESLGAKRLETIVEMARKNGFQGFIEQVQRGQEDMRVEEYTEL